MMAAGIGRDQQAILAIQAAIKAPKTSSLPLIECEFPPLAALNRLGDGSLRSANLVDDVSYDILFRSHARHRPGQPGSSESNYINEFCSSISPETTDMTDITGKLGLWCQACQGIITHLFWAQSLVLYQFHLVNQFLG